MRVLNSQPRRTGTKKEKIYHVMFSRRQAAKHESLNVFYFVLSIFRDFVIIFVKFCRKIGVLFSIRELQFELNFLSKD